MRRIHIPMSICSIGIGIGVSLGFDDDTAVLGGGGGPTPVHALITAAAGAPTAAATVTAGGTTNSVITASAGAPSAAATMANTTNASITGAAGAPTAAASAMSTTNAVVTSTAGAPTAAAVATNTTNAAITGTAGAPTAAATATAGAFAPNQLSGLTLDLDAALGITQSANLVSSWADQSAHGANFTQSFGPSQPTYEATGFTGSLPDVKGSGASGNGLTSAAALSTFVTTTAAANGGTMYVVFKAPSVAAGAIAAGSAYTGDGLIIDGGGYIGLTLASDGAGGYLGWASHYPTGVSTPVAINASVLLAYRFNSSTAGIRRGANAEATTAVGDTGGGASNVGLFIGQAAHATTSQIARTLVYSRRLTDAEDLQVRNYLMTKYGAS